MSQTAREPYYLVGQPMFLIGRPMVLIGSLMGHGKCAYVFHRRAYGSG
jgi:hypothetical protein